MNILWYIKQIFPRKQTYSYMVKYAPKSGIHILRILTWTEWLGKTFNVKMDSIII